MGEESVPKARETMCTLAAVDCNEAEEPVMVIVFMHERLAKKL